MPHQRRVDKPTEDVDAFYPSNSGMTVRCGWLCGRSVAHAVLLGGRPPRAPVGRAVAEGRAIAGVSGGAATTVRAVRSYRPRSPGWRAGAGVERAAGAGRCRDKATDGAAVSAFWGVLPATAGATEGIYGAALAGRAGSGVDIGVVGAAVAARLLRHKITTGAAFTMPTTIPANRTARSVKCRPSSARCRERGFVGRAPFAAYQVLVPTSATYRVNLRRCRTQSPCCASARTCR
jgi:hypothetical protein